MKMKTEQQNILLYLKNLIRKAIMPWIVLLIAILLTSTFATVIFGYGYSYQWSFTVSMVVLGLPTIVGYLVLFRRNVKLNEKVSTSKNENAFIAKSKIGDKSSLEVIKIAQRIENSEMIFDGVYQPNQIEIKVHSEYALEYGDSTIQHYFRLLNNFREKQDMIPYFASERYRIIAKPSNVQGRLTLHVAPMSFAYLALMKYGHFPNAKQYIRDKIDVLAQKIVRDIPSNDPIFNAHNMTLLGLEMLLLTSDQKILLRNRDPNSLLSKGKWGASFAGYCGKEEVIGGRLRIQRTARNELRKEIGDVNGADPRNITLLGLHRNTEDGAQDILGVWQVEATAEEVIQHISKDHSDTSSIFSTTEIPLEEFVQNTTNLFVDIDLIDMLKLIQSHGIMDSRYWVPESLRLLLQFYMTFNLNNRWGNQEDGKSSIETHKSIYS